PPPGAVSSTRAVDDSQSSVHEVLAPWRRRDRRDLSIDRSWKEPQASRGAQETYSSGSKLFDLEIREVPDPEHVQDKDSLQWEREAAIFPSTYRLLRVQQPLEAKVDQRPVLRFSTSYQRFECHGGWKQNIPGCASPQALSALLIS